MTFKEIQDLLKLISKLELAEFKLKEDEFELVVRTKEYYKGRGKGNIVSTAAPLLPVSTVPPSFAQPQAAPAPAPAPKAESAAPAKSESEESDESANYLPIKSPMVGTFYRSSSPDKAAYVKVGDVVEAGSVVCIIEAMKLFNEIESEISGRIVKVMVEDAQPVEYDQVLFLVDPKG
ncbi:acetyl-CoA carboxylase biotin carboxyl carrier protein [Flavilitoribacter nigricans]|uniref:Biotin carboxyl carrier protein of acetyl-CoA carboxylase n=1 Tax=Flavilitoribacter nigricans (strain ATCC 23147 / DSM 23189 / NBRC 102662 / NCIMB 1420 / SS-2) TaxID=1122177 RepID=A0A2D0N9L2_FLAN2|nr:acetyl-CoA carboxylase biotin carboxyl carrier protein [Flavilitoribacter nigricans]PHN05078.1 acetyl-CoA carboxylase, biotin carboxyl carrier protein [Flavilitoribacter nigricans DSM 23189 = NBRC 102662]